MWSDWNTADGERFCLINRTQVLAQVGQVFSQRRSMVKATPEVDKGFEASLLTFEVFQIYPSPVLRKRSLGQPFKRTETSNEPSNLRNVERGDYQETPM